MKIVDLQTFRAMPAGTVFAKYAPIFFGPPEIKEETWEWDWNYLVGIGSPDFECAHNSEDYFDCCVRMENGASEACCFNVVSRDGMFDENQLFAIYERKDVEGLIAAFNAALTSYL